MAWWNKAVDKIKTVGSDILEVFGVHRETPREKRLRERSKQREERRRQFREHRQEKTTPPTVSSLPPEHTAEEPTYVDRLRELRNERSRKENLERVFFDPNQSTAARKAALADWTSITGWYRPENAAEWSNEEWYRWEEIYEAEPELW